MIVDRQIDWMRKRLILPTSTWLNGSIAAKNIISEININTTGAMSLQGTVWDGTGTTGHTASGVVQGKFLFPVEVNPEFPIGFRAHYILQVNSSTSAVLTPTILFNTLASGGAMATAASGALDVPITGNTAATLTKGLIYRSNRGYKNGNWATRNQIFSGLWAEFSFMWGTLTNYTIGTSAKIWVTGLEIDYVPMLTKFPHNETDRPLDDLMTS